MTLIKFMIHDHPKEPRTRINHFQKWELEYYDEDSLVQQRMKQLLESHFLISHRGAIEAFPTEQQFTTAKKNLKGKEFITYNKQPAFI